MVVGVGVGVGAILPIRPPQPPWPRPQHRLNTTRNEIHTHRPICITIKRLARILCIPFNPDMIKGDNLRMLETGFSRYNAVPGKTYDTFYSDMVGICRGSSRNQRTPFFFFLKINKKGKQTET